jgi:hypothetical protein
MRRFRVSFPTASSVARSFARLAIASMLPIPASASIERPKPIAVEAIRRAPWL